MKTIIDFFLGIIKLALCFVTAFFAVCGAAEIIPIYLPWFNELGDLKFGLGFVYFFFVLLTVFIGMKYYKEAVKEAGNKK